MNPSPEQTEQDALLQKMTQELRRGSLVLAVLLALKQPHHGYSLRRHLADLGLQVDEGTLYPLIRRLEKDGLLESEWQADTGRKRRVYRLSALGHSLTPRLIHEWNQLGQVIGQLCSPQETAPCNG
ncbi:PadR family transcriptional regulator [Simiduia agarivorans]|uniref:PadR family transcriptional regulator n=1 Tax=Simiduia agarivorans (strain DSM 21679 / JCM 13881 / BCRC 17597 / SA1) TaxID=1117647 RepID=K4KRG1_SIMAS|nr:PadR family transcriptional regulator [Simiduia agarivorans]AFV00881.1 PadR family transcriptional regulator [Simiduia agarivorans SA1 = DSM 21679]